MVTRLHRVYNSQAAAGMAIAQMRRTTTAVSEANDGAEGGGGGGDMTLHTIASPLEVSVQCGALLGRGHLQHARGSRLATARTQGHTHPGSGEGGGRGGGTRS